MTSVKVDAVYDLASVVVSRLLKCHFRQATGFGAFGFSCCKDEFEENMIIFLMKKMHT